MKHQTTISTLVLLLALGWPIAVHAQDGPSTWEGVLTSTDSIVEAEVVEIRSRWRGGLIVSTVFAEITDCIHGECPEEAISFEVIGGELDGIIQVVSGSQVPQEGEETVLLMSRRSPRSTSISQVVSYLPVVTCRLGERRVALSGLMLELDELRQMVSQVNEL